MFKRSAKIFFFLLTGIAFSCLRDMPDALPEGYSWSPEFAIPLGEIEFGLENQVGFDTLLLEEDTAGFPYWSYIPYIPFSESVDVDFNALSGSQGEIELVILRLNIYNGFPAEVMVQGYLRNRFGTTLDSLFGAPVAIDPGRLSGGGETSEYVLTQFDVSFSGDQLDRLFLTEQVEFTGRVQRVEYFPEYNFRLQMAAIAGLNYQF